ncbi:MAG: lysophospholipid acyltransferase family protein [Candidatus Poseidoniaceae archaeon]|jgi:1-acyl-sn-glycerol-3-phosphate acyltransferase|nr:lysophospholipid acyltransferase family protein [Candidatus Poseidoniaceae archaeon]MDP7203396.1 lysophospholipid acyltransferase family protein [Candidatus Poseidoniaceae archaeon]
MTDVIKAWSELGDEVKIKGTKAPLPSTATYGFMQHTLVPFFRFFIRLSARGMRRIPRKGSAIFAANHLSHVDPLFIISTIRRKLHYLAKDEHFTTPGISLIMKATGQIKTERESGAGGALARASDILTEGRCLGIFPEGTRSKNTEAPFLLKGKTGVARLAAAHPEVPVIPLALIGTREMMAPKVHKIPRLWKRVKINCGHGTSWNDWLKKNDFSSDDIAALLEMDEAQRKAELAGMFRGFTDDLMRDIAALGAP